MNSNERNIDYNFGFYEDEDDNNLGNQMNNDYYQNEHNNNNLNIFNNNMNNNNMNNNNFKNKDNYNSFIINQNNQNQFNNQSNYPNYNFQYIQQSQIKQEQKPKNQNREKLKNAYNLYMQGIIDYKNYNYEIGLDKFERVKATIKEVYPNIEEDEEIKRTTLNFLKQVNQYINITQNQIKRKNGFISSYNYNNDFNTKKEVIKFPKENKKNIVTNVSGIKKVPKDSPSYYMNFDRNNNNINNNNNNIKAPKKDDTKKITNDLRDKILSEIVERNPEVKFTDVIGPKEAKEIIRDIIIVPNLHPDLFKGSRVPPRGLLLFGPQGIEKTILAKAIATECKYTFFNISSSSLTSKYLGENEKFIKTLFDLAHEMQPSIVFIDEIESILSNKKEEENDEMKRLKTEFIKQLDRIVKSRENLRILFIGATNKPFDLEPDIIRLLPKRVYVGPFNMEERKYFIKDLITQNKCDIKDEEYKKIAEMCNNYSNSDLKELCREAAYEPLRELNVKSLKKVDELRPIVFDDFVKALKKVKGTLTKKILMELENWNKEFGALS